FFFSSRRRHTRSDRDWSSDVCSSDLICKLVPTHNDLGVLLVQSGDVHAGIEQWETSLQIDPDDGNALNNLAWVLATFPADPIRRSEERRVGKECRSRWTEEQYRKKK